MTNSGRQWLTFPWWFRTAFQREWHMIWVFRIIWRRDGGSREDISGFRGAKLRHQAQQQILLNTELCCALGGRRVTKWWRKWFKAIVLIGLKPAKLLYSWKSPGYNTRMGSHSFLQENLPTQGSNPGLLHCRWILYHLSHQGTQSVHVPFGCLRFVNIREGRERDTIKCHGVHCRY